MKQPRSFSWTRQLTLTHILIIEFEFNISYLCHFTQMFLSITPLILLYLQSFCHCIEPLCYNFFKMSFIV